MQLSLGFDEKSPLKPTDFLPFPYFKVEEKKDNRVNRYEIDALQIP